MATKELLMAIAVRQIKTKIFCDPIKYKGKAYNLITDVLGESAAMDVKKEGEKVKEKQTRTGQVKKYNFANLELAAESNTKNTVAGPLDLRTRDAIYRGTKKEKKKNKPKNLLKKDHGWRGPRARSKHTPVVARKEAAVSDHFVS